MKKQFTNKARHLGLKLTALLFALLLFVSGEGRGQTPQIYDDFNGYTAGTLAGQGSWARSGTGTDLTVTVPGTALTYTNYNGGGGNYVATATANNTADQYTKAFTTGTTLGTNTFYYSFLLKVSSAAATGSYFFSIKDGAAGTNYIARTWIKTSGAGYVLGVSTQATAAYGATVLSFNTTYLVVVSYESVSGTANDLAKIWVNPSLTANLIGNVTPEASQTSTGDPSNATYSAFSQRNQTSNNAAYSFDGLRVSYGATSATAWTNLNAYLAGNSAPTVTTQAASSILTTTATGNGNITATGGVNPTERGFCWGLASGSDPDISVSFSHSTESGSFSTGAYTGSITGLTAGTQYKVRAYATNSVGTSYGSVQTFYTLSNEPSAHASSFTATANSQNSITTTWSDNDGNQTASGFLVLANTSGTFTDPIDGVVQADGSNVKNIAHGVQTCQWTGLTAGTQYFFKIFPYNGSGSSINYKTDGTAPTANAYTNSTSVTVNSSTSWTALSNVGSGTDVTIPTGVELTVNANASCAGITIENGGKLTINNPLTTQLVSIEEGGSLIDNDGTIQIPALAAKNIAGNAPGSPSLWQWHFLSSPVVAQKIVGNFINYTTAPALEADVDFYRYNPDAANPWINIKNGSGNLNTSFGSPSGDPEFVKGMGYLVSYNSSNTPTTFDGNLNTGNTNITLVANKFNLIGNPFPSAINWVGASYANLGSNSVWIYNENKSGGAGYEIFTSGTIAPMQGFFIKSATATTITLANSIRTHNSSTFYKNSTLSFNEFILKFSNGNNWDVSNIQFMNNASANEDRNDALKLFSMNTAIPQVYTTISTGQKFAVNALPELNANTTVPVGIYVPANGNYTISADGLANFSHCTSITLEDLKTNTTQNLMQNPVYSFTAATTDNANRFVLHFATAVGVNEIGNSNGSIYAYDNNIYINAGEQIKQINVYNTMGQLLKTLNNVNGLQKINMNGNATGYYIVKVVSDKNVYSEKVLIK